MSAPLVTHGMPFEQYLAVDAISAHGLMQIERSPAHFDHARRQTHAPTPAQALGTLTHLAILEPEEYARRVRVAPDCDRRTKAGKEVYAAFDAEVGQIPGAVVVTPDQDARARGMREAVMHQPFARALLADGHAEVTLRWDLEATACKARPDFICVGHEAIVDLKTAADASPDAFAKSAGNWRYHLQTAWYADAAVTCGLGERAFVFLVVEPEPPHAAALYQLDEVSVESGRARYRRALDIYRECAAVGRWPGYSHQIQTIGVPRWAL
jgi:exodeoxyribonuclease VIII